jgi:isopropylmalate/homocitrate/citramalate synthase
LICYPEKVRIVEVGPRDGLQNETRSVSVEAKVSLIENLAAAGLKTVEAGSFVSPKWVPQMADTAEILAKLHRLPDVGYPVLVPNLRGLEAALTSGATEIAFFAAASESFSQRNINASVQESLARLGPVAEKALAQGLKVRGYVSCVLGCPYEGEIALEAVVQVASELHAMGCYEISLGDTIGVGTPLRTQAMLEAVSERVPLRQLAVHFHDTYGQALANVLASLQIGITVLDSSVAGLGGCPYAPGAAGNVATEDLVYMLNGMGIETGVDLVRLAAVGRRISRQLGRAPASKVATALAARIREQ